MRRARWVSHVVGLRRYSSEPHAVLGVVKGAKGDAIKEAFRRRVKEMHPDLARSRGVSKEKLTKDFQALQAAYKSLVIGSSAAGDATTSASAGSSQAAFWDTQCEEDVSRHKTAALEKLPVDLFLVGAERDFYAALDHAYHGPNLRIRDPFHWPMAFELEVRNRESLHPHLLEITSGRTRIGYIRERPTKQKEKGSATCGDWGRDVSELELCFAGTVVARAERRLETHCREGLPPELQDRLQGSERCLLDTIRVYSCATPPVLEAEKETKAPRAFARQETVHGIEDGEAQKARELQENLKASAQAAKEDAAVREREMEFLPPLTKSRWLRKRRKMFADKGKAKEDGVESRDEDGGLDLESIPNPFWIQPSPRKIEWGQGVFVDFPPAGEEVATVLGMQEANAGLSWGTRFEAVPRRPEESTAQGECGALNHYCRVAWSAGVELNYWFSHDGKLRARISRAALPGSDLWYFEPRSEDHTFASFYVELDPYRALRHSAGWGSLHPSVVTLTLAYRALDILNLRSSDDEQRLALPQTGGVSTRMHPGQEGRASDGQLFGFSRWFGNKSPPEGEEGVASVPSPLLVNARERAKALSTASMDITSRIGHVLGFRKFDPVANRKKKQELHAKILNNLEARRAKGASRDE